MVVREHPYIEREINGLIERTFDSSEDELVWHRDHEDRIIKLVDGRGWKLQLDNSLPIEIIKNTEYIIPDEKFHRLIKGEGVLVLNIQQKNYGTNKQIQD